MTQIWENDRVMGVTPILAGPCAIAQIKTTEKDGYRALQVAFGEKKLKNIKKPQQGHLKKINSQARFLREFRIKEELPTVNPGDLITAAAFELGDIVDATGTSKGKGFQGVVKRHHFAGGRKTHGNKDQLRMPGSIGPKGPAHVFKGTRMAGNMGNERVTVKNLKIVKIDEANDIIYVLGAVPGAINGLVILRAQGELKFISPTEYKAPLVEAAVVEENNVVSPEVDETKAEVIVEEVKAEDSTPEAPSVEAKVEATELKVETSPEEIKNEAETATK